MFNLIQRSLRLSGDVSQADPYQNSASDMIALDARFATLTPLKAGQLLGFAMKLLDFPAQATRFLCGLRGILRKIVGYDPIRAVGRHLNPEQFHFVIHRKSFDLDDFSMPSLRILPRQGIDPPVRRAPARIIHLPIALERTVVRLALGFDKQHQVFGGVPRIHQHGAKWQRLVMVGIAQHLLHMIELGLAIAVRIVNAVINDPMLLRLRINIHAGHHANALDDAMRIATVLAPYQFNLMRKILVNDRIVKHNVSLDRNLDRIAHVVPYQARGHPVVPKKSVDRIMAHVLGMISKMGQCMVDRAHQQVLAVIQARWFHTPDYSTSPFKISFP